MKTFNVKARTGFLGHAGILVKAKSQKSLEKRLGDVKYVVKISEVK